MNFWKAGYVPENAALVVAGDITSRNCERWPRSNSQGGREKPPPSAGSSGASGFSKSHRNYGQTGIAADRLACGAHRGPACERR